MFFEKRTQQATQTRANMDPTELLKKVDSLAKQGLTQKQIADELGYSTTFTLNSRLVRASQATGKPIPAFKPPKKRVEKPVETVEVKRRGKGEAFGVNIPQEPLTRVGVRPGTKFSVKALKGRVVLTVQ
ncbi:MAG: hypothetical protein V3U35_05265 [Candidatus Neomarinimicrobiota bacterium]